MRLKPKGYYKVLGIRLTWWELDYLRKKAGKAAMSDYVRSKLADDLEEAELAYESGRLTGMGEGVVCTIS